MDFGRWCHLICRFKLGVFPSPTCVHLRPLAHRVNKKKRKPAGDHQWRNISSALAGRQGGESGEHQLFLKHLTDDTLRVGDENDEGGWLSWGCSLTETQNIQLIK